MKRNILNLFVTALAVVFFAACGQQATGEGEKTTGDAEKPATEVSATDDAKPADAAATGDAAAAEEDDVPKTTMAFEGDSHDFGEINEGDKVSHTFKFTNSGQEPLIINSAKGSCGCTVPEWPKEPIPPGGEGEILVEFNSKGKKNKQTKTVTINANTDPNPTRLTIKANVKPAEGGEAATPAPAAKPNS